MRIVQASQAFSVNYASYDQNPGLFVGFNVYDVSSGTANFIQKIAGAYSGFGVYMADFTPATGKTYLVIGIVYTDNTYLVVDTSRAPSSGVFQAADIAVTFFGFTYPTYDQQSGLSVRASVYIMTSGTPVFTQNVSMPEVAFGVYFGFFNGTVGDTFQAVSIVYTNGSFSTPDLSRSPSCDGLDSILITSQVSVLGIATLVGQNLSATLIGDT